MIRCNELRSENANMLLLISNRWMAGARPRYDDRPPRDYRPAPYGMERGYEERPMYDRGYDRRPPSRYDERYARY